MAVTLIGPFKIGFPVAFRSGGDTTRDAFGKHIEEIKRIYGYLNALDSGKLSAGDIDGTLGAYDSKLQEHIDSTNPHPNWNPSFDDITGDLDASRVHGNLTNATIDADKVNNLESLLPSDKGDGITKKSLVGDGYVEFNNGLIIQWGTSFHSFAGEGDASVVFPYSFKTGCYGLSASVAFDTDSIDSNCNIFLQILNKKISLSGFEYHMQAAEYGPGDSYAGKIGVKYIAIGE